MLTHTYAVLLFVPLTLAECARTLSRRRVDWAVWLAILSASLGVLVSLPLLRAAKAVIPGVFPATSRLLANSYELLLGPAAGVLSAALILYCVSQFLALDQPSAPNPQPHLEFPELVALLAFVAIPFFAFFVAKIAGSPFVLRYAITSILGFSCLFGIAVAARPAAGLAVLLVLIGQIAINFLDYAKGTSVPEPVTSLELSTSANRFAEKYQIIRSAPNAELPIVLMVGDLQFLPIFHYAPPDLASRLVYLQSPGSDPNFAGAVRLRRLCGFPGRFETPEDFLRPSRFPGLHHPHFLRSNQRLRPRRGQRHRRERLRGCHSCLGDFQDKV
jgi:hypothetical protein